MDRIYFDYNSSAPCRSDVSARMEEVSRGIFGNPSSAHREGRAARAVVAAAREEIAAAIGARPGEIVFTSGGTEADHLAIVGVWRASAAAHPHIVTSKIEHDAVRNACRAAESAGVRVSYASCDAEGVVDARTVEAILDEDVILVSLMHANNETGVIQPVREVAARARGRGILAHTDAVQSLGKIPVRVDELGVDLLSLSGHKIGGPKGVGALYVREGTRLEPVLVGGPQESGRRAGTENVAGIAGLAAAVTTAVREQAAEAERLGVLKRRLWDGLRERVVAVAVNGSFANSTANTLNVSFEGAGGEGLMMALDDEGIAVSTGAACAVGGGEPSHVLEAMCLGRDRCRGAIRFSMGKGTTAEQIERALEIIPRAVARLRA